MYKFKIIIIISSLPLKISYEVNNKSQYDTDQQRSEVTHPGAAVSSDFLKRSRLEPLHHLHPPPPLLLLHAPSVL